MLAEGFEAVLHFAAKSLVGESMADPAKYWSSNLVRSISLLEAIRRCPDVVFSSTAAVYGEPERTPIVETDRRARPTPTARPSSPWTRR